MEDSENVSIQMLDNKRKTDIEHTPLSDQTLNKRAKSGPSNIAKILEEYEPRKDFFYLEMRCLLSFFALNIVNGPSLEKMRKVQPKLAVHLTKLIEKYNTEPKGEIPLESVAEAFPDLYIEVKEHHML